MLDWLRLARNGWQGPKRSHRRSEQHRSSKRPSHPSASHESRIPGITRDHTARGWLLPPKAQNATIEARRSPKTPGVLQPDLLARRSQRTSQASSWLLGNKTRRVARDISNRDRRVAREVEKRLEPVLPGEWTLDEARMLSEGVRIRVL